MEILQSIWASIISILNDSGLLGLFQGDGWKNAIMIGIACFLLYLAIGRQFEPLLLLPIAFGMLLVNLPLSGVMDVPTTELVPLAKASATEIAKYGQVIMPDGQTYVEVAHSGGLLYYLYLGVKLGIYPPLIFLGIGAMSDFGPLIANPKSFILGAAAQIGIFFTFCETLAAMGTAETPAEPMRGFTLPPVKMYISLYSYMALVPIIQPPIMRLLTTKKERAVVMTQLRTVSKTEKIMFPIIVTIVVALLLPSAAPLVGMLMLGNLMRESGVVKRISDAAQNELMNIVTIFLGTTVGATARAEVFLTTETLLIVGLGLTAFCLGTAFGVIFGKLMYIFTGGKVNPLIGSAGVSAVPMAARVSQKVSGNQSLQLPAYARARSECRRRNRFRCRCGRTSRGSWQIIFPWAIIIVSHNHCIRNQ